MDKLKISTNNGSTWISLAGNYTEMGVVTNGQPNEPLYDGTQSTWVQEEMDLTGRNATQNKFQFQLKTDYGVTEDDWYVDDILVYLYGIVPVELSSFTATAFRYQREPAESQYGKQEMGSLAGPASLEPQLVHQGAERFLADAFRGVPRHGRALAQGQPLHQPHHGGPLRQELEVVADQSGQDLVSGLAAGECPRPSRPDRLSGLGEATGQDSAVQLGLRAEEIARGAARDARGLAQIAEAGGVKPPFCEQTLGGIENRLAASGRIALAFG